MNLLGNPVRLAMLQRLAHGLLSGSDIAAELQVSLRAVSSHMHMLKCAELAKERSTGAEKIFTITRAGNSAARKAPDSS